MDISFVPFDKVFLEASWEWLKDIELRSLIDAGSISKEEQEAWYNSIKNRYDYYIWGVAYKRQPAGVCGLKNITDISGEYWGYIGEKDFWGKGIGQRMLGFVELFASSKNLQEVKLKVLKINERAIRLYLHNGYTIQLENEDFLEMNKIILHD